MEFTSIPTEQTTAFTDLLLTVLAFISAIVLQRFRRIDPFKVRVWGWALILLAVASKLGAIAHGLTLSEDIEELIWQPLELCLGLSVALCFVGALYDLRGRSSAVRAILPMLFLVAAFYSAMLALGEDFLIFVIYEAIIILAITVIYAILVTREKRAGALLIVTAMALNLIAAGIQISGVEVDLFWKFDHNGIFHLVQCLGLIFLTAGLMRSMKWKRLKELRNG